MKTKKIISVLLVLVLCLGIFAGTAAAELSTKEKTLERMIGRTAGSYVSTGKDEFTAWKDVLTITPVSIVLDSNITEEYGEAVDYSFKVVTDRKGETLFFRQGDEEEQMLTTDPETTIADYLSRETEILFFTPEEAETFAVENGLDPADVSAGNQSGGAIVSGEFIFYDFDKADRAGKVAFAGSIHEREPDAIDVAAGIVSFVRSVIYADNAKKLTIVMVIFEIISNIVKAVTNNIKF